MTGVSLSARVLNNQQPTGEIPPHGETVLQPPSCDSARATGVAFLAEERVFVNAPEVSVRIFKLYRQPMVHKCIVSNQMPSVGGVMSNVYLVQPLPLPVTATGRKERLKSIGSMNAGRVQREGMPGS
ncbi:hypothetical protein JG687_00005757 [Phytophthora cactorum]|uniref:Uncharacterized protein n=1 Tax=Phytophthora cactorum TaxID=29920 RepID=A0A329RE36_9STRA|nr:hypothetical protein Pcac1_g10865 [Phytophthora cactorum]KAG2820389.1 hypothetical protein PC112_g11802 [Phytophthora cactorum]KAG2902004.1 hypothetical protein PC114_g12914 [Phytophthora cactorum]KAG2915957.1 hypothetical protein PC115_g11225 [Phytophthora cactorum]KAG2935365.1 hypothetical protein PC117_g12420 [Phytophthora cactorum]